jgi:hypothetical protein
MRSGAKATEEELRQSNPQFAKANLSSIRKFSSPPNLVRVMRVCGGMRAPGAARGAVRCTIGIVFDLILPNELFETALGLTKPCFLQAVSFAQALRCLIVGVDFVAGSHFARPVIEGRHPVTTRRSRAIGT